MANVVCEYASDSPTRPTSAAAGSIHSEDNHPDYGRSMSPPAKRFAGDNSYYSGMSEPGRRVSCHINGHLIINLFGMK